ncbi:sulfatase [Engelhardtia mirabilis]|uniref:sulfatase n=1 Tax=Engelhardtia mirabilis TaxID=2528011 RepID=UPI003AF3DCEE
MIARNHTAHPRPLAVAALAAAVALTACSHAPKGPRDVLLVTIDTLRADMLSSYGHPRRSTPNLDALAASGARFERHYSTAPMTGPSHATMLTGLYSSEHGLLRNGKLYPSEPPCLPEELADAGYQTLAVVGSKVLDAKFGMDRGFDVYDDEINIEDGERRGRPVSAERYASEVVDTALAYLGEMSESEPVFAWIHVFDPHAPFEAPVELLPRRNVQAIFDDRLEPSELFDRAHLLKAYIGYELEIAYTDQEIGRLLEGWNARERGRDSVVCVTSDHGEGMGEHGYMGHGLYLYDEQLHVPLILRARGVFEPGLVVSERTSAIDLGATLLGLSGAVEEVRLPGGDLAAFGRGEGGPRDVVAERPLFSEWDLDQSQRRAALDQFDDRGNARGTHVALVADDWKYIWSSDVGPELYDLVADPREVSNVAAQAEQRLGDLAERFDLWRRARQPAFVNEELDDDETLKMLEELGYR